MSRKLGHTGQRTFNYLRTFEVHKIFACFGFILGKFIENFGEAILFWFETIHWNYWQGHFILV